MNQNLKLEPIEVFERDSETDEVGDLLIRQGPEVVELDEDQHEKILKYLKDRLTVANQKRTPRIQRFAGIDQMLSTWQKLSAEDSKRDSREESTGRQQALPINLPLASSYIEDAVSFFAEVFAPIGGNFFASPGKKKQIEQVKILTQKMEQDMKQSAYYSAVVSAASALCKYNFGGFRLNWEKKSRLSESDGNVLRAVDVYNLLWDPSILDVSKLHTDGEWVAFPEVRNRIWLIRNAEKYGLMNLESVFKCENVDGTKSANYEGGKATYFKNPPSQTRMPDDGKDSRTAVGDDGELNVDWTSYGLGLASDNLNSIEGYEITTVYIWINPDQFDLERDPEAPQDSLLELWEFMLCDANWIISAKRIPGAIELPVYLSRIRQDEMNEAMRSIAELIRPFQRFISFLLNTHVDGIRKNVYGLTVYDPTYINATAIQNGEVAGMVAMHKSGDARLAMQRFDSKPDTYSNIQTAGEMMNLMKQLFPNQALPSQIAGMDRAVNSQVAAVMQGAMRRMHMLVRSIDSTLMLPVRMGMYRNIANFDPEKSQLTEITPEQVAELLASGLGQINREAAAEQIRSIIFALIQNPDSGQSFDLPGLMQLWSVLLNIGTDLSEFVPQQVNPEGQPQPQVPPEAMSSPSPDGRIPML